MIKSVNQFEGDNVVRKKDLKGTYHSLPYFLLLSLYLSIYFISIVGSLVFGKGSFGRPIQSPMSRCVEVVF